MFLGILINTIIFTCIALLVFRCIKNGDFATKTVLIVFCLKLISGSVYGIFYAKSNQISDTWNYHYLAIEEYKWLQTNFYDFAINLFQHGYTESQTNTFFNSDNSYWKDLPLNILLKLLAIFNTFSKGNYYVNVALYNIVTIIGNLYFFKTIIIWFAQQRNIAFILSFLFPPLLFWTSGIHKDGIVFTSIAIVLYGISKIATTKNNYLWVALTFFAFMMLYFFRNFAALSLLPWLIAFTICIKTKKAAATIFFTTLVLVIALFVTSSFAPSSINFTEKIKERQQQFLMLKGNSLMQTTELKGGVTDFIQLLPMAINHAFARPYFTEAKGFLGIASAFESYTVLLIFLAVLIFYRGEMYILKHPFILLIVFFSITNYLLIGYTVPFYGAVVRYRVIFQTMLLLPTLIMINKNKWLNQLLQKWI